MSKFEILHTRLGELAEMIDCHAIASGVAEPKGASRSMSFNDILKLR